MANKPRFVLESMLMAKANDAGIAVTKEEATEILQYILELETENRILRMSNEYLQDDFESAIALARSK